MKPLALVVGALAAYVLVRVVRDQRSAMRDFSAGGVTYTAHGCAEVEEADDAAVEWVDPIAELREIIHHLRAENARLREALRWCLEDLEAEIAARYQGSALDYPIMRQRFERDMEPVRRAREALEADDDA